jgi:hypothetical protein
MVPHQPRLWNSPWVLRRQFYEDRRAYVTLTARTEREQVSAFVLEVANIGRYRPDDLLG